jgi:hypothetical protein
MMFPEYPRMQKMWIGTLPYMMLYGAEVVETVLSGGKHYDKGYEYSMLHPWLGRGLLTRFLPFCWGLRQQLYCGRESDERWDGPNTEVERGRRWTDRARDEQATGMIERSQNEITARPLDRPYPATVHSVNYYAYYY